MSIKQKVRLKLRQMNLDNFLRVNRLFVLVYLNRDGHVKRFKTGKYYILKGIIKNYCVTINGKNFHDQPIDSDLK